MSTAFFFERQFHPYRRFLSLALILLLLPLGAARSQVNVLTYHNDNARTGQNLNETILTPANVKTSFGKLFSQTVDGYVYSQPLYVSNVFVNGSYHNVLIVTTEHDSIYAFDADSNLGVNSAPLWQVSCINSAAGVTTVPPGDLTTFPDIVPEVGITGTPVIALGQPDGSGGNTGTIYVVAKTKENGKYIQRLHALDLATGVDKLTPVVVAADVIGSGTGSYLNADGKKHINFQTQFQNERCGLALSGNVLYIAFGSHGDNGPYHGWILTYNPATLNQIAAFNTSPTSSEGGIWMAGGAPAFDSSGNLYCITGNGYFNANTGGTEYGDSFLRINPNLTVKDYFAEWNQQAINSNDVDQGSGGAMLLPDSVGSAAHQHLLVGCGKEGNMYLLDRDNLGGFNQSTNNVVQQIGLHYSGSGTWSTPAYWNGNIYYQASNDVLKQFSIANGMLSSSPVASSTDSSGFPGCTPAISANGATNGIVWTIESDSFNAPGPALLRAHDPTNVATSLYSSGALASDNPGNAVKFSVPTIANGKVYVGAQYKVSVFGLIGIQPVAAPVITSNGTGKVGDTVMISDATSGAAIYYTTNGTAPTAFSQSYTAPFIVTAPEVITAIAFKTGYTASAMASKSFGIPPAVPTLTATPGDTQAILNWTASPSASGYNLKVSSVSGGPYSTLLSGTPLLSYTNTGLKDGVSYYYVVSAVNGSGESVNSAQVSVTPAVGATPPPSISFPTGFNGATGIQLNGSSAYSGSRLRLTNGATYLAASAFYNTIVNAANFTDTFQVQMTNPQADGFAVCLQSGSPNALGGYGIGLGYQGIGNSIAVKFDLYNNNGEGINSTGLYVNGASPTTPSTDLTNTAINLHSGDIFTIVLSYNGTTLTVKETDTVTGGTATQSYPLNLAATIGSSQVYAGFTAGTGGLGCTTDILNWTFTSAVLASSVLTKVTVTPATVSLATGSSQTFSATGYDQYGVALAPQPAFVWSVDGGGVGSVNGSTGFYVAGGAAGSASVRATSGSVSSAAAVTLIPPTKTPANLTATASTPFEIDLAWTNTDITQTSLTLTRTGGGATTTIPLASNITAYADTSVSPLTAYTYTLVAGGPGGNSAPSAPASATTPDVVPLQASNLAATVVSPTQLHLTWTDNSSNETGFGIYRQVGTTGIFAFLVNVPASPGIGNTVAYDDIGLTPGTYYSYHLKAFNATGFAGDFTGTHQTTWVTAPSGLIASPGSGSASLSWTAPPGTLASYTVKYGTVSGAENTSVTGITGTSTTITGLSGNTPYYFVVSAVNDGGTGPVSNETTATPIGPAFSAPINFPTGFNGATGIQLNGSSAYSGSRLRLTNGATYLAASAFYNTIVNAASFTDTFQVQMTNPQADGFAVCLQSGSPNALGGYGIGLGYQGIGNSIAVKFDLYNNNGEGINSTGLYVNGASPTTPSTDLTNTAINLHSGDIFTIVLSYNGTTLTVKETDTVTGGTATQSYPLNLAATIGSSQVYAGFTGGTGGLGCTTDILNWTFTTVPIAPSVLTTVTVTPATVSLATGSSQTFSATGYDQYGVALAPQPAFVWSIDGGGVGSVNGSTGVYAAGPTAGSASVRATSGSVSSAAAVTVKVPPPPSISFPSGFTGSTGIQLNGSSAYSGSRLRLTNGATYLAASAFYNSKVSAASFTDTFQVQMTNPQADGFAVCLQSGGPTAIGGYGIGLGYSGIGNSIAVKFDLYNNNGEGINSTGLYVNGASPTTPSTDLTNTAINLHSGDIFTIVLSYNGTTLTVKETDTVTGGTATQSYPLNLAATIGSSQVYAGFTAGTGGLGCTTDILNWTYGN